MVPHLGILIVFLMFYINFYYFYNISISYLIFQCLGRVLTHPSLKSQLSRDHIELTLNLLRSLSNDPNSFIRSSCYTLWAALLDSCEPEPAVMELLSGQVRCCLQNDQEAIVRRSAVDLMAKLASRASLVPASLLQARK